MVWGAKLIDKKILPEETHAVVDLINRPDWPDAVPDHLICGHNLEDRLARAASIIEYVGKDCRGYKVLDFGCGDGHVALEASRMGAVAVGYDLKQSSALDWEKESNCYLTSRMEEVVARGPYDLVIIYDVLDHCEDALGVLGAVKELCKPTATIFTRCHSWMSRHGAHQCRTVNKGWLQIFFTKDELASMDVDTGDLSQYYFPVIVQTGWFKSLGLKVQASEIVKSDLPPIIQNDLWPRIIGKHHKTFPFWQLSQSYNDYWITLPESFVREQEEPLASPKPKAAK